LRWRIARRFALRSRFAATRAIPGIFRCGAE
jgi:hypothetical protein